MFRSLKKSIIRGLVYSFGASVRGKRTGIIFNDAMDDFSTPESINAYGVVSSPSNYIEPGKMAMSSMNPSLVFEDAGSSSSSSNQRVVYLTGAAGGTRITTQTAFVSLPSVVPRSDCI